MRRKATLLLILAIAAPFSGSLVSTSAEVSNPGQGKAIPAQRSEAQQSRRLAAGSERAEVSEASSHRSRDLAQFAGATNGTWCNSTGFPLVEATISQAHAAMLSGRLTCSYLIKAYTDRINNVDKSVSTLVNTIRVINTAAAGAAQQKDGQDSFDVRGLATTAGSISLIDNFPAADATLIRKMEDAGAIVLAKTNMGEFAISPLESRGSLFGVCRNPYDTDRTTAGSSGGSAAAVAASFGMVALGTDTGDSVRGPASHCGVVGLRPTLGLTSRHGIIPARLNRDTAGPMARTMEDMVRLFEHMVGPDPRDPLTGIISVEQLPDNYTQFLDIGALRGVRLGVVRSISDVPFADPEILEIYERALDDLSLQGATLVESFNITGNTLGLDWHGDRDGEGPAFGHWNVGGKWEPLWACMSSFKEDLNAYLANAARQNPKLTHKSLQDIVASGAYDPSIAMSMAESAQVNYTSAQYPTPAMVRALGRRCGCLDWFQDICRVEFRKNLVDSMNAQAVDALIYPSWSTTPRLLGDYADADLVGNNSPDIQPHTGGPALTVPMGFTSSGLPLGLQFIGRPWDEPGLIRLGYAYEQATRHRQPPPLFPECPPGSGPPLWDDPSVAALSSG